MSGDNNMKHESILTIYPELNNLCNKLKEKATSYKSEASSEIRLYIIEELENIDKFLSKLVSERKIIKYQIVIYDSTNGSINNNIINTEINIKDFPIAAFKRIKIGTKAFCYGLTFPFCNRSVISEG